MFFLHNLQKQIPIHPSYFGRDIKENLKNQLYQEVEGLCTGEYYIVAIVDISDISAGKILPGSGQAEYTVYYRAIVWKPFRGETVRLAQHNGYMHTTDSIFNLLGRCACHECEVPRHLRGGRAVERICLASGQNDLIVGKSVTNLDQLIPSEIKWDGDATPPQYTNGADEVIEKNSTIRLKIIGLRSDIAQIYAIGSITEDYHGVSRM